jgi:hypothetical protein
MVMREVELKDSVKKVLAYEGKDREFISDHGLHAAEHRGVKGVVLKVRLTSYRALPLSCIEGMSLRIDGQDVDMNQITFILNNYSHKLADLKALSRIWWFILEHAMIFVPMPGGLRPGPHVVEGTLITVEPYVTAGRFSFHNSSKKTFVLEDSTNMEVLS